MKLLFSALLVGAWFGVAAQGFAQRVGNDPPQPKDFAPKKQTEQYGFKAASLDQLIAQALKDNPDLLVAEAKVRVAEAELLRTRIRISTEIQAAYLESRDADAGAAEGLTRFRAAEQLFKSGNLSREDYGTALLAYTKLQAEAAKARAKLPYLLGKQSSTAIDENVRKAWAWSENVTNNKISDDEFIRRATLDILGRPPHPQEIAKFKTQPDGTRRKQLLEELLRSIEEAYNLAKQSTIAGGRSLETPLNEKLRAALDTSVKLTGSKLVQAESMNFLRQHLPGFNLHVRHKASKDRFIPAEFNEPIPVGALMQYLEDELQCYFILRDYGIVVVAADERLPPGAVRVTEAWGRTKRPASSR